MCHRSCFPLLLLMLLSPFTRAAAFTPAEKAVAEDRRVWDGYDPFHQPAASTASYGSGDADLDGSLSARDVDLVAAMLRGETAASIQADLDLDGDVDGDDLALLRQAVASHSRPRQWDLLATRAEREAWLTSILRVDPTDRHPESYWFSQMTYAVQLFVRAAFYRKDLAGTVYKGGPTAYNIPMYLAEAVEPSFIAHISDAVLVGDDPLDFASWRFIDPESDADIHPGDSKMPFGTELNLVTPGEISDVGFGVHSSLLRFAVNEAGVSLLEVNPRLVRERRPASPRGIDNTIDLWHSRIVPTQPPWLAFERGRDDRGSENAIGVYGSDLPVVGLRPGLPLTSSLDKSRLLDVSRGPDGTIHLLLYSERDFVPTVFYARLDPAGKRIAQLQQISEGVRIVRRGRIVAGATGALDIFWLESSFAGAHPYPAGVYWTRRSPEGTWPPSVRLTSEGVAWPIIDLTSPVFDVTPLGDGLLLAWVEFVTDRETRLMSRRYRSGQWEEPVVIDTAGPLGLALATAGGGVHLFDWATNSPLRQLDRCGDLRYRTSIDGLTWTAPETLDGSGQVCSVSTAAGPDGRLDVVWDRKASPGPMRLVWKRFQGGQWGAEQPLSAEPGERPMVTSLPDGSSAFTWTSYTLEGTAVEGWVAAGFPCTPAPGRLCLQGGRFAVDINWRDRREGGGAGRVAAGATDASGFFWFFSPELLEVLAKVVDGCQLNGHFWLFTAGATDVGYTLRVTDTTNGTLRSIAGEPGQLFAPVADTTAFSCR